MSFNIISTPPAIKPYTPTQADWEANKWKGELWIVTEDWVCVIYGKGYTFQLTIKKGFITDGGSIPGAFENIISPLGIYLIAFLIHDAFYGTELIPRALSDDLLFQCVKWLDANWVIRNGIYSSVDLFGGLVWDDHTTQTVTENRGLVDIKVISISKEYAETISEYNKNSEYGAYAILQQLTDKIVGD